MKTMFQELARSVAMTLALALVCCGAYPIVVWAVAQVAFPAQANGSLIVKDGQVIGSKLIAQNFTGPNYFHPRPSAALSPTPAGISGPGYDPMYSGGSNSGPTSKSLIDTVKQGVADYRKDNELPDDLPLPADAVTASGSGLDPHISVENANLQKARVAKARGITVDAVEKLIAAHTEHGGAPLLGDPGVNVLTLNLALDALGK